MTTLIEAMAGAKSAGDEEGQSAYRHAADIVKAGIVARIADHARAEPENTESAE